MTDRPILFNAAMVNALLSGRKKQTRRVITPGTTTFDGGAWCNYVDESAFKLQDAWLDNSFLNSPILKMPWDDLGEEMIARVRPRIEVGDRLYVREAWTTRQGLDKIPPRDISSNQSIGYMSDDEGPCLGKFRQGIHMPRKFSRLTLVVTDVRVQRVAEISEEDAMSEGLNIWVDGAGCRWFGITADDNYLCGSPVCAFESIWNSINEPRGFGWDANPWVVAVTFSAHKCNIDKMGVEA